MNYIFGKNCKRGLYLFILFLYLVSVILIHIKGLHEWKILGPALIEPEQKLS